MKEIESDFIFILTNAGSEKALKLEIETQHPGWRLSYQRPGFVTLKRPPRGAYFSLGELGFPLACARRICLSLGRTASRHEAEGTIKRHPAYTGGPIHHVRLTTRNPEAESLDPPSVPLRAGDCVGTVVEVSPEEFWVGMHLHGPFLSPDPGGIPPLVMPQESPSRAWLKLEEAIRFFNLSINPRDIVVELGCAPGGVVLALLNRGVSVIGVDPAQMADVVMQSAVPERRYVPSDRPWFYHCQKPAALVGKRDLGSGVTWFMSDMNQSPEVVLAECARICRMARTVHGVLITLKLANLPQVVEKQQWLDALSGMGFTTVRLQQLAAHNREIALLGLRGAP